MYFYARKWVLDGLLVSWQCQDWGQMRFLAHSIPRDKPVLGMM